MQTGGDPLVISRLLPYLEPGRPRGQTTSEKRHVVIRKLLALINLRKKAMENGVARLYSKYAHLRHTDDDGNIVLPDFLMLLYKIVNDRLLEHLKHMLSSIYDAPSPMRIERTVRDLTAIGQAMLEKHSRQQIGQGPTTVQGRNRVHRADTRGFV
ncbi:unnamed protein product [Angiostrongylus costaricensis]|uniref:Uncharacterized protein n=1 Tax=Angiostrongylus costaricensis TaxID=334426 RepID=A0A0R3PCH2_ANGCS|nr:unnamed protein product [Angiostrongylus costaricensis]